jgi:hypothetical protein
MSSELRFTNRWFRPAVRVMKVLSTFLLGRGGIVRARELQQRTDLVMSVEIATEGDPLRYCSFFEEVVETK